MNSLKGVSSRLLRQQVHVVVFAVQFHQCSQRVRADVGEDAAEGVDSVCVKHTTAILSYEDQTHMQLENIVLAVSEITFMAHKLRYVGLCKLLTRWRSNTETSWLKDAPTHPLQQALKDLERAYTNFFAKRADFPCFKKKGQHDSFRYPDPKQIGLDQVNSRLCLPKLGWLRYRNSRKVLGTVKNLTVSLSCGKWFVSIQTEREVEQPLPRGGAVGIDLGIVRFATLSDGTFYAPLNSFKRHASSLRKAQQALDTSRSM